MKKLLGLAALLAGLPALGAEQEPPDFTRLTEGEMQLLNEASGQAIPRRGIVQRMLRDCRDPSIEPMHYQFEASASDDEVYREYHEKFGGELSRGQFDALYGPTVQLPPDCSVANIKAAINYVADPNGPFDTMDSLLNRTRWRPAGVIPPTVDLAVKSLQSTPGDNFSAEITTLASTVTLAYERQSGCTSVFRVKEVWGTRRSSIAELKGTEFTVDWRQVSAVGSNYSPKAATILVSAVDQQPFASFYADYTYSLLGAFERLRQACKAG